MNETLQKPVLEVHEKPLTRTQDHGYLPPSQEVEDEASERLRKNTVWIDRAKLARHNFPPKDEQDRF